MTVNTTATIDQLSTAWVAYAVYASGTLIYYGACPLHRILELTDLGRNSVFRSIVTRDTPLTISELSRHADKVAATADIQSRLAIQRPACNAPGAVPTDKQRSRVRGPDGEIYDNASQAAIANGVSKSTMSNHLNRRAGYARIKGRIFERLED